MSKKVVKKKKSKLIKTRLFTVLFAVMFIVSLFTGIKAFAETGPFKLNSATISDKASGVTGSISSFNDSEVINDITFHKIDDYATFKFELRSNLNREITILEITDDNSNSYIAYEYDKHENEKLASNGTLNFIVKAVYKTELTDTSKRNQTNNVKFTIKYLDNGEEKSDEIIVNPKTGDGISKSIVMLIISSVGLITCITLDKKRKSKKLSKLSVLILTGLVLSPIVVKAATFAYELTLKSTIGLYDKVVVTIDDKVNTPTTQTIEYNTKLDSLPSPSKEGYTLTNWTVNNEEFDITKEITEDITIEANYRKNNYTITFNANVPVGGTLDPATSMADMDMKYDEEKNLLPNGYLVTGYLFDSWNTMPDGSGTKFEDMDSVKNLTSTDGETVTLYARWGATPYTVIFDKNSSQATGTMENISKAYNETFNLPENTYERIGYSFAGWNKSPAGDGTHYDDKQSVKNLDIDGEVTLYAEWSPTLITISFDINTDDPEATGTMAGQIVVYDVQNRLNENKYTRTGYAFDSWNTKADGSGTKYDDKADITNVFLDNTTLYAQWAVTPYTVIFNKNSDEATGSMENQDIPYGQQVALTKNTYTREHYKFMGWNTQADGQGTHYDDEQEVKNLDVDGEVNLYAEWKERIANLKPSGGATGINSVQFRSYHNVADIVEFKPYEGTPDFDNIQYYDIARNSNFPVYIWQSGDTLYWWSEAETIYMNEDSSSFFSQFTKLETIDFTGFDFSLSKDFSSFFSNTKALKSFDLSQFVNAKPTSLASMFNNSGIESIDLSKIYTKDVINMNSMFSGATNISTVDLSVINAQNVTDMKSMFEGCTNLKSVNFSNLQLNSLNSMARIFYNDRNLESINFTGVDTPNLRTMEWMFGRAKIATLDLSDIDTENVTNLGTMFYYANIQELDVSGWDTRNVETMGSMFAAFNGNGMVLDLSNFNTENLKGSMYEIFISANVSVIDLSSFNIDEDRASKISMTNAFSINNNVETIYATDNLHLNHNSNLSIPSDTGGQSKLVGGAGSTLRSLPGVGSERNQYARVDDPDNGKPGIFTIKGARYIRYNGNGADSGEMTSHYLTNTGSLKANTFTNTGKTFAGWNTEADGSGTSYTDEQLMSDIEESKTPLTLYAQWE